MSLDMIYDLLATLIFFAFFTILIVTGHATDGWQGMILTATGAIAAFWFTKRGTAISQLLGAMTSQKTSSASTSTSNPPGTTLQ